MVVQALHAWRNVTFTQGARIMVNTGKAIIAGLGARALTGSIIGFIIVFAIIYWLLGGTLG